MLPNITRRKAEEPRIEQRAVVHKTLNVNKDDKKDQIRYIIYVCVHASPKYELNCTISVFSLIEKHI